MTTVNVTLNLPDDVAERAREAGLLDPQAIQALVYQELAQHPAVKNSGLLEHLRKLEERNDEPMSMEEVNAEIHAYRAEKRLGVA